MMIALFLAAVAGPAAGNVAYDQLAAGKDAAAIAVMQTGASRSEDPAVLLNLGIAHARQGDLAKARALFTAALQSPERTELETSTGSWVDSRVLARRAIAMLDDGTFAASGRIARN